MVLENIFPFLVKNTCVHLDEYYSIKFPGAKTAVDEFCKKNNLKVKKIGIINGSLKGIICTNDEKIGK